MLPHDPFRKPVPTFRDHASPQRLQRRLAGVLGLRAELLADPVELPLLLGHLDGQPPRTLQQIGKEMSLTRERVRQIEQRAIARARRLLS